jgi:RNA polymerase sigma factor (sigma-70 family)
MTTHSEHLLRHLCRLVNAPAREPTSDAALLERFVGHADEDAFAEVVRRYGPMVQGVCRRVLGNAHEAQDAAQATFLVLARKAAAIRPAGALAGFLYGVASRLAQTARRAAARRRQREARCALSPRPQPSPLDELTARELMEVLDEELRRLPELYRQPVILCCLEGLSLDEAAARLGWTRGSVKGRLERGRARLHARLARRGLSLSAVLGAAELFRGASAAGMPVLTPAATAHAAVAFTAGRGVIGAVVSPRAVLLAEGGFHGTSAAKVFFGVLLFFATVVVTAAGALRSPLPAGEPQEAGQAAAPQPPDPGGEKTARLDRFGDPLPAEAISRLGTLRFRTGWFPDFVRFTGDGKGVLTQDYYGIRTWEVATGKQIHALPPNETGGPAAQACLSPDGKLLVTTTGSGVRLWDVTTARQVRTLATQQYFAPCFSPDGTLLAVLTDSLPRRLDLLEVASGRRLWSWSPGQLPPGCVAFTPDGKDVVVAGWSMVQSPPLKDHTVRFLDARTGKQRQSIDLGTHSPLKIAISPDGGLLAVICWSDDGRMNRIIRVWEVASGKERFRLDPPILKGIFQQKYFSALAFAPDDNTLLTAGGFENLIAWDLATGKERRRFGHNMTATLDLAFSPDGKAVAVARPGNVTVIDRASGEDLTPTGGHRIGVNKAVFSPDGRTVVTTSPGPCIISWDPTTGRERRRTEWYEPALVYDRASDDGRLAFAVQYVGQQKGRVRVWDLVESKERDPLALDFVTGQPTLKAVGPGGKVLVVGPNDGDTLFLLDVATGRRLRSLQDSGLKTNRVGFADDGRTLVAFCADHAVQVWDIERGVKRRQFGPLGEVIGRGPRPVGSVGTPYQAALSPDGKWIAYLNHTGIPSLFETATMQQVRRLNKLPDGAGMLTFSPDSRVLACAGGDPVIHLLEVASGKERRSLAGHRGHVHSCTFSRDGRTLLSASADTTALVWDLTGRLQARGAWDKPLSPEQLDACWAALASEDAAAAYGALRRLAADAARAVPYLAGKLPPVPPADAKRVATLLADLDSNQFEVREKASRELADLGETAESACRQALQGRPSAEARQRLERLLEQASQQRRTPSAAGLRTLRAVEVLEGAGTPEARQVLEKWAAGAAEARLTEEAKSALRRLARQQAAP